MIRPMRPDKLARGRPRAASLGRLARGGDRRRGDHLAGRRRWSSTRTASSASATCTGARTRSPGRSRDEGVRRRRRRRDHGRNHRGFVDATLAISKLGANGLYMNTAFSGPQLVDVMEREGPAALIYDEEFSDLLGEAKEGSDAASSVVDRRRVERRHDLDRADRGVPTTPTSTRPTSRAASSSSPRGRPGRRRAPSAARPTRSPRSRRCSRGSRCAPREKTVIAAPLFHSWGFAHFVARARAELDLRAAAQVRPRGDAEGDRRQRRDRARSSCR